MAYSYFTKKLLAKSNEIDLASVFPEKQQTAKERLNTNYSLPQIVEWIRDNSNNFKKQDGYMVELDLAVKRLIDKYYESSNIKNPFSEVVEEDIEIKSQPRIPTEVTVEGVKTGKPDVISVTEVVVNKVEDEIQSIKDAIEYLQAEADAGDEESKDALEYLQGELLSLTK